MFISKFRHQVIKKALETTDYNTLTKEKFTKDKYEINFGKLNDEIAFKWRTDSNKLIMYCSKFKIECLFPLNIKKKSNQNINKVLDVFEILENNDFKIMRANFILIGFKKDCGEKLNFKIINKTKEFKLQYTLPDSSYTIFRENHLRINNNVTLNLPYMCDKSILQLQLNTINVKKNNGTKNIPIQIEQINELGIIKNVKLDCTRDEFILGDTTKLLSNNIIVKQYNNKEELLAKQVLVNIDFNDGTSLNTEDLLIINTDEDDVVKSYMIEDKAYYNVQKRQKNYDINQVLSR